MATKRMIRLVNAENDTKDLGDWILPTGVEDEPDERHNFVLGAACDKAACAEAKATGKKGPRAHTVDIPADVYKHIKENNPTLQWWLAERMVFTESVTA